MSALSNIRRLFIKNSEQEATIATASEPETHVDIRPAVQIADNDPLIPYMLNQASAFEVDKLNLESAALQEMRESGVKLAVPLVSQGELVGVLSLGPRLSEQDYSVDDRRLLNSLASQAAPALRVAQLARQQQAEATERERFEQELQVARIVQQTLLPKNLPALDGWLLDVYWQPARAIGGDFYDFIELDDNLMCIIAADVTDKGVPAALVMASARTILRAAAERLQSPGAILGRANDTLYPDIPPKMFVTCLCMIVDLNSGSVMYANAGHNLPYLHHNNEIEEIVATGMPLGLMPGMNYEETSITMQPGDMVLLHSDGLAEAHNPAREIFGFPRLKQLMLEHAESKTLIQRLLYELDIFTGPDWEQEDDVTFVLIKREEDKMSVNDLKLLDEFAVNSAPGNEREAIARVEAVVEQNNITGLPLEKLKTAVGEATMNAMEHGNQYQQDVPVIVRVYHGPDLISVHISDQGTDQTVPKTVLPDLDAKLAGQQSPRGWGLFLIQNMVDEMNIIDADDGHTVELIFHLDGGTDE